MHEPEGLQFPKALQWLSPPELVGIMATMSMQEVGWFVPRRRYIGHTDSEHILPISDCGGYILFCHQILLWRLLCSDHFSNATCLHTEGQIGALLLPWLAHFYAEGADAFLNKCF